MAIETDGGFWKWIAVTLLLPALLWLLRIVGGGHMATVKSLKERLEHVEKSHVPRTEFDRTIESLRRKIDEGNTGTHERLDKLMLLMVQNRGGNGNG